MKKTLQTLAALLLTFNTFAQVKVATFEDITVAADSFIDGRFLNIEPNRNLFYSNNVVFTNSYDTSFGGYWSSGFAISTSTDSATGDFTNLYGCIAAKGNNSTTYAAAQNNAVIIAPRTAIPEDTKGRVFNSVYVNNATYAYKSMLNGDMFAKKFGGTTGNDSDWFKLTIVGYFTDSVLRTDTVAFYLADYRFTNNAQDYIVKDWTKVNLTALGKVDSIAFMLSSSDEGQFGMNTPGFFCIDDVEYVEPTVGIAKLLASQFSVYPNPANAFITVNSALNIITLAVMDLSGKTVLGSTQNKLDISNLNTGIYILKITTDKGIYNHKFVKGN